MSSRPFLVKCVLPLISFLVVNASNEHVRECRPTAFIGTRYWDRVGTLFSVRSEIGLFANAFAFSASGELVHVQSGTNDFGCNAKWINARPGSWIAVVRWGGCSVETKIENAINHSAAGLIIVDHGSVNISTLDIKFEGSISVVFAHKWKGDEIVAIGDLKKKLSVDLLVTNPCVKKNENNMRFVSISFLCFLVLTITLAWMVFYYVQRYRDIQAKERKSRGYSEADEKALKSIPIKTVKANDKLLKDESECCAICIDPYRPSDVVRTLICNHEFHKTCIDPWLLENRTCPMCKKDILRHYGSVFLGSQESILQVVADESTRLAGPSSPHIQVVVVNNDLDNLEIDPRQPLATSSELTEITILSQRVQLANEDLNYIDESNASIVIDSSDEFDENDQSADENELESEVICDNSVDSAESDRTVESGNDHLDT